MRIIQIALFSLLVMGGLVSCNQSAVDPLEAESEAFSKNIDDIKSYASTKGLSLSTTASGLHYVITAPASATAKQPVIGEEIEFSYIQYILQSPTSGTGVVTDKVVDTTYATKSVYYPFVDNSLLSGLQEGILLMREGASATLLMPARLAYGSQGSVSGTIPANTPVRFDVKLKRSRSEDQQISEYITRNNLGTPEVTSSGLRFIRTSSPTSTTYAPGATLAVRYNGRLLRSVAAFDSTSGTTTRDFTLGNSSIIKGFEEGLSKLKVGEKATLIFPSSLGYGSAGRAANGVYVIPPLAPLRFDVEVVSVR